ncbi:MAG: InlB B-repeat-containing protein, partial [Candidatus Bathyarchaeota archaeon]|nr:InlB B-repeat-containing protein [Candidatus Termiticorpusculum sp.]
GGAEEELFFVGYDANWPVGGMVGSGSVPDSYLFESGSTVTVSGNTGGLAIADWTFVGWSTMADGSSGVLVGGRTFTITEDTLLYAQWIRSVVVEPIIYTVTYDGNGFTGGDVPVDGRSPYVSGSVVLVKDQGSLVREGYVFLGWATDADAEGPIFTGGSTFNLFKDTVLYAVWAEIGQQFTVTYDPGTHGVFDKKVIDNLSYGDPTPEAPEVIGDEGWEFDGWYPTWSETVVGTVTYTAQWRQTEFTVTFKDWNGNVLDVQQVPYGGAAKAPSNPVRDGYTFTGWSQDFSNVTSDLDVVAQYTQNSDSGGSGGSSSKPSPSVPPKSPTPPSVTPPPGTEEPEVPPKGDEELPIWALVNLVLSVVGLILALLVVICVLLQKKQKQKQKNNSNEINGAKNQYATKRGNKQNNTGTYVENDVVVEAEKKRKQRRTLWVLLSVIMGIAGIVVFILTEDMTRPMALVDKWTIVNVIIFIVEIIAIALIFKHKDEKVAYTVRYCLQGTETSVFSDKTSGSGAVGFCVSESAIDIAGYVVVGKGVASLTLDEDVSVNVITFYYVPNAETVT